MATFSVWWNEVQDGRDLARIPIFWIGGRSGEGKSVLLLQLTQAILLKKDAPVVISLASPDQLPQLLQLQSDIQSKMPASTYLPAVVLIDDLHLIQNREQWESALSEATALYMPHIVVIACGPSPERARFQDMFSSLVSVRSFDVPNLSVEEMSDFRDWFRSRTGLTSLPILSQLENRMLVVLMFELVQGKTLQEFARSFRRRLAASALFEFAKAMLAANCLQIPSPPKLFEDLPDTARDMFIQLCSASQLHFEYVTLGLWDFKGHRLAHPQIAWRLYIEWTVAPVTVAIGLGRDLSICLGAAIPSDNWQFVRSAIHELSVFDMLSNGEAAWGTIDDALLELYRKQSALSAKEQLFTLHRWVAIAFARPDLQRLLEPKPVDIAVACAADPDLRPNIHPSLAGWLWRLSEIELVDERRQALRQAAHDIVLEDAPKQGTGRALAVLAGRSVDKATARDLCMRWLRKHSLIEQAHHVLKVLYRPLAMQIGPLGASWLRENIATSPAAPDIATLHSRACPDDVPTFQFIVQWLRRNSEHPSFNRALTELFVSRPNDGQLAGLALQWIANNSRHPGAGRMLFALIRAGVDDNRMFELAISWLMNDFNRSQMPEVLGQLIAMKSEDGRVIELADRWLRANENSDNVFIVLSGLITRSRDQRWLDEGYAYYTGVKYAESRFLAHRQRVLVALLAGSGAAHVYVNFALDELETTTDPGIRMMLQVKLAQVLANNIDSSLSYLSGQAEDGKKREVCKSLSHGLRKYPRRAREFLAQVHAFPTEHAGLLLAACVGSKLSVDSLAPPLIEWLNNNYRARGYGLVIRSLAEWPRRWDSLSAHGTLRRDVVWDYRTSRSGRDQSR